MSRVTLGIGLWAAALVLACGGSAAPPRHTAVAERGPVALPVDGDPNGLWWDEDRGALYLADDNGNRILNWTDAAGFGVFRDLPATASPGGLGQLVRTSDGSIIVTRFGFGKNGDVAVVPPSGEVRIVPGLDGVRRRIGLSVALDGSLYDAWFVKLESGGRAGGVGQLSLDGAEREIMTGLTKPVGVLAVGARLFVSDQDQNQIVSAPLSDPASYSTFASLPRPDLLAEGPGGSIFAGSAAGGVHRITATGETSVFQAGFQQVRGVAYDAAHRRLFVVDHDTDEKDGVNHTLHILPVD